MTTEELINKTFKAINEDALAIFKLILEDDTISFNERARKNTLKDSRLYDSLSTKSIDNTYTINIFYNDYLKYIQTGRKPKARKVPVKALYEWAKRKGLLTNNATQDNKFIYAVRNSIYVRGIKPRPVQEQLNRQMLEIWHTEWSDKLFEALTYNITKFFN